MSAQAPPNTPVIRPAHLNTPVPHLFLDNLAWDDTENGQPGAGSPRTTSTERQLHDELERLIEGHENLRISEPYENKKRHPRKVLGELKKFNEQRR